MPKPESGRLLQAKTTQVICLRELAADLPAIRINKIGDCPYYQVTVPIILLLFVVVLVNRLSRPGMALAAK